MMRIQRIAVGTDVDKVNALANFLSESGYDRIEIEKINDDKGWAETNLAVVMPKGRSGRDLYFRVRYFSIGYEARRDDERRKV
jgi:hypothetical protein